MINTKLEALKEVDFAITRLRDMIALEIVPSFDRLMESVEKFNLVYIDLLVKLEQRRNYRRSAVLLTSVVVLLTLVQ